MVSQCYCNASDSAVIVQMWLPHHCDSQQMKSHVKIYSRDVCTNKLLLLRGNSMSAPSSGCSDWVSKSEITLLINLHERENEMKLSIYHHWDLSHFYIWDLPIKCQRCQYSENSHRAFSSAQGVIHVDQKLSMHFQNKSSVFK